MDGLLTNADFPTVQLKEPVNIREALSDKGMTFEINFNDFEEETHSYNPKDMVDICNFDCLGIQDEDVYDDSTPFESIGAKMKDLTTDGGIKKRILRDGYGDVVPLNSFVYIHYNAYLEFNEVPFDSTYARKKVHSYHLGQGQTIPGLDIGVQSMKINEKAQFLLQPKYAYGKSGCAPRIPPDSEVLFEVELQKFVDSGAVLEHQNNPENLKDFESIYKYALALCEKGNDLFRNSQNYKAAIKQYNIAVSRLDCVLSDYDEQEQRNVLLLRLYANLAICHIKQEDPKKCCTCCNKVYNLCKNSTLTVPTKVYFNNAKALIMLNDLDMAEKRLRKAAQRDRDNPDIVRCFLTINHLKQKRIEQDQRMANILVGKTNKEDISDDFKKYVVEICEDLKKGPRGLQAQLPDKLSKEEIAFVESRAKEFGMEVKTVKDKDVEKYSIVKLDK